MNSCLRQVLGVSAKCWWLRHPWSEWDEIFSQLCRIDSLTAPMHFTIFKLYQLLSSGCILYLSIVIDFTNLGMMTKLVINSSFFQPFCSFSCSLCQIGLAIVPEKLTAIASKAAKLLDNLRVFHFFWPTLYTHYAFYNVFNQVTQNCILLTRIINKITQS